MIEIGPLTAHTEFRDAVRLQQDIWGFDDIELLPLRLFVVASKIGGQAFGAFDGGRMIGFCLAIPGLKPGGKSYLHSHMLGVLPEYRDSGIGRRLKLAQRDEALARGIDLIEWTFDPLEIKNAYFNIERLGAIVRRYVPNQYGITSSPLHGGLPTDRCIAEWWIASPARPRHHRGRNSSSAVQWKRASPSRPISLKSVRPIRSGPARSRRTPANNFRPRSIVDWQSSASRKAKRQAPTC